MPDTAISSTTREVVLDSNRPLLNATFVTMAYAAGVNSAILNPCDPEMMGAIRFANVVAGADQE